MKKLSLCTGLLLLICLYSSGQVPIPVSELSSTTPEFSPTISPDGKTIIFETNDAAGQWKLFYSTLKGKTWSKMQPLTSINEAQQGRFNFVGGPCLSYDGKTLYFCAEKTRSGSGVDLYMATRGKGWNDWRDVRPIEELNSEEYEGFPTVSPDGRTLVFAGSNMLLMSRKKTDGSWGDPIVLDLGEAQYPRFMPDNRTLVFVRTVPNMYGMEEPAYDEDGNLIEPETPQGDGAAMFYMVTLGIDGEVSGETLLESLILEDMSAGVVTVNLKGTVAYFSYTDPSLDDNIFVLKNPVFWKRKGRK